MRGGPGGQHLSSHSEKYQVVPALLSSSLGLMLSNKRERILNRTRTLSKRLTSVGHLIYLALFSHWPGVQLTPRAFSQRTTLDGFYFFKLTTEKARNINSWGISWLCASLSRRYTELHTGVADVGYVCDTHVSVRSFFLHVVTCFSC